MLELARDFLHSQGKYSVIGGIMSPVHVAYGKKVAPCLHYNVSCMTENY